MITNLSERCIQYVKDNLSSKNVFRALEFGIFYENETLKVYSEFLYLFSYLIDLILY